MIPLNHVPGGLWQQGGTPCTQCQTSVKTAQPATQDLLISIARGKFANQSASAHALDWALRGCLKIACALYPDGARIQNAMHLMKQSIFRAARNATIVLFWRADRMAAPRQGQRSTVLVTAAIPDKHQLRLDTSTHKPRLWEEPKWWVGGEDWGPGVWTAGA